MDHCIGGVNITYSGTRPLYKGHILGARSEIWDWNGMKEMQGYNRNRQKRSDCVMCQVYVFQPITFSWLWPRALTCMVAKLIGDWNCLVKCKPVMFNYALINAGGPQKATWPNSSLPRDIFPTRDKREVARGCHAISRVRQGLRVLRCRRLKQTVIRNDRNPEGEK